MHTVHEWALTCYFARSTGCGGAHGMAGTR